MTKLPRLIATDLDGTLVRSDGTVSPRSHKVLRMMSDRGVKIVGITGRGPRLLQLCRNDIPSADALVLAQGGFAFERSGTTQTEPMRNLRSTMMDGSQTSQVVRMVEEAAGPLTVIVENDTSHDAPLMGDVIHDWPFPVPILAASRESALAGSSVKTFLRSDTVHAIELLSVARQVIPSEWCSLTEAGIGFVEVCPAGVNKGVGLTFIAEHFGVDLDDVLVFGDALNDLPMFATAGRSVAVDGAYSDVKIAADAVTGSNDEDGVADYLEQLLDL